MIVMMVGDLHCKKNRNKCNYNPFKNNFLLSYYPVNTSFKILIQCSSYIAETDI